MFQWIKARIPSVLISLTTLGVAYLALMLYGQHTIGVDLKIHGVRATTSFDKIFWNTETGDLMVSCKVNPHKSDVPVYGFWGVFSGETQYLVLHNDTFAEVLQAHDLKGELGDRGD